MVKVKKQKNQPSKKTPAPCPLSEKKPIKKVIKKPKKQGIRSNPLIFEKKKRSTVIGVGVRRKRDLSKYIKFPKKIRIERKKRILLQRLKVPPAINQFNEVLRNAESQDLFNFLNNYKCESKQEKKKRLEEEANKLKADGKIKSKKPITVKCGIKYVTRTIERKQAKLVIIANDVLPIELVLFLPALCRLKGIPYCIVKNKAKLGLVARKKKATVLCLTEVNKAHEDRLNYFSELFMKRFNNNVDVRRKWGGQKMSAKSLLAKKIKDKALKIEEAKKKVISAKL
ncbi:60S ribosomal protein L7-3, putative [Hepatocystis sp. ex Piliocolobus tephrosceles]|nr:60S ribosomal protein L7-3, putative [Hepatocystis sp. ex Piliocolobus tephrosceles]